MEHVAVRQTLDGRDFPSLRGDSQRQTGKDAPPIHVDRAGAALPMVATFLRPGEPQVLTQRVEQGRARVQRQSPGRAIDAQEEGDSFLLLR